MFCLVYIPTNEICEVECGVCYHVFNTREEAEKAIRTHLGQWAHNYKAAHLPANIFPA